MNMLDLFSGIGGMSLAAGWAGIPTCAFVEIDPFCRAVLAKHWPDVPQFGDIHHVTATTLAAAGIPRPDIIAGGFPCQPSSSAGKRKGTADARWLWPEMARLIAELCPTWVVAENVSGLISLGLDSVLADLDALDYATIPLVYPAQAMGAPHIRERIFLVAHTRRDDSQRWGERRDLGSTPPVDQGACSQWQRLWHATEHCRPDVADTTCQCDDGSWHTGTPGRLEHPDGGTGRLESSMGREPYGISTRMDGHWWPAGPGEAQYAWEAPRAVTGTIPNRVNRLKALGNAVVPAQVYPIFAAIATEEAVA